MAKCEFRIGVNPNNFKLDEKDSCKLKKTMAMSLIS